MSKQSEAEESPVVRVDADGVIRHANRAAEALLGPCVGRSCQTTLRPRDADGVVVCPEKCPRGRRGASACWEGIHTREQVGSLQCVALGDEVVVTLERMAPAPHSLQKLTPREREVLSLVADGLNAAAIAAELGITRATARTHVERCRTKLGARSQAQAVVLAFKSHQLKL